MEGCTGGNGPTPQPECAGGRWEGAGAQELAMPPPPPGLGGAPPRWCSSPASCWVKWSGSRAICSDWPPLETPHAETEAGRPWATEGDVWAARCCQVLVNVFTWNNPPWSNSISGYTGGVFLAGIENAAVLKLSVDSIMAWGQTESTKRFRLRITITFCRLDQD